MRVAASHHRARPLVLEVVTVRELVLRSRAIRTATDATRHLSPCLDGRCCVHARLRATRRFRHLQRMLKLHRRGPLLHAVCCGRRCHRPIVCVPAHAGSAVPIGSLSTAGALHSKRCARPGRGWRRRACPGWQGFRYELRGGRASPVSGGRVQRGSRRTVAEWRREVGRAGADGGRLQVRGIFAGCKARDLACELSFGLSIEVARTPERPIRPAAGLFLPAACGLCTGSLGIAAAVRVVARGFPIGLPSEKQSAHAADSSVPRWRQPGRRSRGRMPLRSLL